MESGELKKNSLSREAWLEEALRVLRDEGVQGVRVERLARDLKVSKGSFYWHFKNREDLLRGMLEYWQDAYNSVVVDNPDFASGDAAAAMLSAMQMIRDRRLDEYELAFRAWADHDPMAEKVVRDIYARRRRFISGLFERMGFRGPEIEIRTRIVLCFLSWEPSLYIEQSDRRRKELLKGQHEFLTRR